MIHVYNDVMRGTLSAHSSPSRMVANDIAECLDLSADFVPYQPQPLVLSHVNPTNHPFFLDCIVRADKPNIQSLLSNALASSIRVDGSVDKQKLDNIFVMAKIVSPDGSDKLVFIGFAEPDKGKAQGKRRLID